MGKMFIIACAYPAQTLLEVSVSVQGGGAWGREGSCPISVITHVTKLPKGMGFGRSFSALILPHKPIKSVLVMA